MSSTDANSTVPPMSYVYAVTRGGAALDSALSGRAGLRGGSLRTVSAGDLVALVSSVPHDAFDTDGLRAQMEDIKQLEVLARTHHAVVEAAYESATVLPMRLATVYLDDTRVTEMLAEQAVELGDLLARLEGHVELGVKVYADPREAATASAAATAGSEPTPVSPGRAYLQQRRTQQRNHRDAYRAAGTVAAEVPARVDGIVRARLAHRPQQGDLAAAGARTSPTTPIWWRRPASPNSGRRSPGSLTTFPAYVSRSPAPGRRTPSRHRCRRRTVNDGER